jgi:hypothetical protein
VIGQALELDLAQPLTVTLASGGFTAPEAGRGGYLHVGRHARPRSGRPAEPVGLPAPGRHARPRAGRRGGAEQGQLTVHS